MQMTLEQPAASKMPRKRSAKAAKQEDVAKVKATIHLSSKAAKALGVFAVMTASSNSAVVEDLILEHCRRFVVSDRAKSADGVTEVVSES